MTAPRQDVRLPPPEPIWIPFNAPVFQWERLGEAAYEAEWLRQGKRPQRALEVKIALGDEAWDRFVASTLWKADDPGWCWSDAPDEEC